MIKKSMAFILSVTMLSGMCSVAEATRRRKVLSENLEEEIASGNVSYGDIYYTDNLPGPDSEVDWSGYNYNGVPIKIQDTSKMTNFKAEDITNFSDAIVDYMGWDAVLGSTFYDVDEDMLTFKAEGTGSAVIGYAKKKFGDGTLKFQTRLHSADGKFSGWLGLMVRCNDLQYVPWSGMNCYLIVMKEKQIELQKYFPNQEMLLVVEHNALKLDTWHNIEFENTKQEDGLFLRLVIDGTEIFSYTDSAAPFAPEEGYVNFYYQQTVDFKPVDATISHGVQIYDSNILALKPGKNKAYADGKVVSVDEDNNMVFPYIFSDRTFVPLRFISERLGMEVEWDAENKTAVLTKAGHVLKITPGFAEYTLDGNVYAMDVKAEIRENRTFVPIRFVGEALGKSVIWEDNTVFITNGQQEITEDLKNELKTIWEEK